MLVPLMVLSSIGRGQLEHTFLPGAAMWTCPPLGFRPAWGEERHMDVPIQSGYSHARWTRNCDRLREWTLPPPRWELLVGQPIGGKSSLPPMERVKKTDGLWSH